MAKSPLAKNSKTVKHVRNSKNVVTLHLTIPYKSSRNRKATEFDISHLLYQAANSNNVKIDSRIPFLRSFCKKANQYVDNGRSARTIQGVYEILRAFIVFSDAVNVDPFSEAGYLKYAGNDGELRHRIKMYIPSKRLWEMSHGDELGIKETSASQITTTLRTALLWCGLPANTWATHHRGFTGEKTPYKGYSDAEEEVLVARLSELFFILAPQLIAAKNKNLPSLTSCLSLLT
ncbi:hypothetical protein L1D44_16255 [Shewanella sp. Isolate13]|uniref:hypothetical protein n=1 Tax=Shewanella sp. Isolate13 TaxID=2908531 RepID=UPI001EFE1E5B|nr:hypothetical protein [Shewanella sp. Isolate13]MCG9731350.1 hypothetical protein [Shewanella sp. Isolate13]